MVKKKVSRRRTNFFELRPAAEARKLGHPASALRHGLGPHAADCPKLQIGNLLDPGGAARGGAAFPVGRRRHLRAAGCVWTS